MTPTPGGTAPLGDRLVARIGYGAMQLEKLHDDRSAAIDLLRRAVALGIDHYDTAHFYGDGFVNGLLREALPLDEVTVVTKVGADPNPSGPVRLRSAQKPHELRASVEQNLRDLGVARLDVVNLRRFDVGPGIRAEGDQLVPVEDQLAELVSMRDEGLIGDIGLSSVTLDIVERALPAEIVCVQNSYNLIARDAEELLDRSTAEGIAWVPFFPLGSAFDVMPKVTDDAIVVTAAEASGVTPGQVGLAWLLQHAPNTLLIPGTASIAHLEENVAAGDLRFDAETMAALDSVSLVVHPTSGRGSGVPVSQPGASPSPAAS